MNVVAVGLIYLTAMGAGFNQTPPRIADQASSGKVLFEGRGRCLTCHMVDERGSADGAEPELDRIASNAGLAAPLSGRPVATS